MTIVDLYIEFFMRFFIIMGFIISLILTIAVFLKVKDKDYLLEIAILGFMIFTVLWIIHQFTEIIYVTSSIIGQPIVNMYVSKIFALMASIMIFSAALVKNRLKNY